MKKFIFGLILGFALTFCTSVYAGDVVSKLVKIYDSATGGKIETFNAQSKLNVKLGAAAGTADNAGGTLILKNDNEADRVELGITKNELGDAGLMNLKDTNDKTRVALYASHPNYGSYMGIVDPDGNLKSYINETTGKINGNKIITEDYLKENYISKTEVQEMINKAVKEALNK